MKCKLENSAPRAGYYTRKRVQPNNSSLHIRLGVVILLILLLFLPFSATSKENIKLRLGGRLHIDGAWFKENSRELKDDIDTRRARISIRTDLFQNWRIFTELDLIDEEKPFESLWLSYRGFFSS